MALNQNIKVPFPEHYKEILTIAQYMLSEGTGHEIYPLKNHTQRK